ncbi:MAG: hypothetical protein ACAH80_09805 [Alphaproteobacteria bacterium]
MKIDFKNAAIKAGKSLTKLSTLLVLGGAVNFSMGAVKGVQYYGSPEKKEAYDICVTQKKSCTAEQMALAEQRINDEKAFISMTLIGSFMLTLGNSRREEDRNNAEIKQLKNNVTELTRQKWEQIGKTGEEARRAEAAEQKLAVAEATLAPYLADEKRKTDDAADKAAKQQLNDMAQDATTLQGQMKPAKKITIKPQPPGA